MASNGEYRVEDLFRCHPKYAVISLSDDGNPLQLFKDLLAIGYSNVHFYDDLCDHPAVRERLEKPPKPENPVKPKAPTTPRKSMKPVKMDFSNMQAEELDIQAPTSFQIQITQNEDNKKTPKKLINANGLSSTASSSNSSSASSHDYDHTIDQVIGKAVCDPSALVSSLFTTEAKPENNLNAQNMFRQKYEPVPEEYVKCRLCDSKIMATRYSNLANHVRRHATTKQYQCSHCNYQNNEQAKVRLHMQNQHADYTANILDKFSSDMKETWDSLMNECFPNYNEVLNAAKNAQTKRALKAASEEVAGVGNVHDEPKPEAVVSVQDVLVYRCIECTTVVACLNGQESTINSPLIAHLRCAHTQECLPYKCDECGYKNGEQWKVRWHISHRHTPKADRVTVTQLRRPTYALFVRKFFPNALNLPVDDEESQLSKITQRSIVQLGDIFIPTGAKKRKMNLRQ